MKKAMLLLLHSGLILYWSMGSIALSSDNPDLLRAKKPQAVGANDAIPLTRSVQSYPKAISPNFTPGPGTTIGTTHYDYGSNGSPNHNIVNYGDGTISIGRMASTTSFASGSPDRGTYYTYYNGSTWSSFTRVESARRGWGNIDQFKDYGGIEAIVSHTTTNLGPVLNVHAAKGSGIWTEITPTNFRGTTWPKMATGSSATIHFVAAKNPPDTLFYYRTQDAGSSFDKINIPLFPGRTPDADGYDIAAKGTKVAVASAGSGKDVWLAVSNDNGNSWTETKIYDINESLPFNQSEPQPDGSCVVIFDNNNNVHLVWSNYTGVGDSLNHPILNYGLQNKIMHWSQATGVTTVAVPLSNAMTFPSYVKQYMPGVDGANVTGADIGVDNSNNLFVVYQGQVGGAVSSDSLPYCHLYAVASTNGGVNWTSPLDITSVTGSDNSFPAIADNVDNNLHIVYFTDPYPGNSVQGNHQDVAVDVKYLKVLASAVLGGTTPTITVVSPNGGENWSAGSMHNIAWNSTNVTFVKLEYTTNGGGSWNLIDNSVPAAVAASNAFSLNSSITRMQQKMRILDGEMENSLATNSYLWTIPNTVSSQCLVRVSDASNSTLYDISDNYFTISQALPPSPGWSLLIDTSKILYGVKAIDSLNVWACGRAMTGGTTVIIRTTNGGITWFNAKGNIGTTNPVIALEASNANVAWAGDVTGSIYYTTDGGTTWSQQISISGSYIDAIKRVDASILVAVGDPSILTGPFVILRSTNNGQTWYQLSSGVPNSDSLEYAWYNLDVQGSVLRFGTRYGKIMKSTDKGITWSVESQHTDVGDIFGLSFTNPSSGVFCGAGGKIKRTTDGGATWTSLPNIGSARLSHVELLQSNSIGWIVGQQGVIGKTLNSGATWSQENSGTTYTLYGSSFLSPNLGWVVGNSSILKYNTTGPSPTITVTPSSFSLSLQQGDSTTRTMTIGNTGGANLTWSINNLNANSVTNNQLQSSQSFFDQNWSKSTKLAAGDQIINRSHVVDVPSKMTTSSFLSGGKILLLSAGSASYWSSLKSALVSTGMFSYSDFDTLDSPLTLTVTNLQSYSAVLVWTNGNFSNPQIIGDVLKQYVDGGGGVIIATYALSTSWAIQGGLLNANYSPFLPATTQSVSGVLDLTSVTQVGHPIFQGIVNAPQYWWNSNYSNPALNTGGKLLAKDTQGNNLVAENPNGKVVGITIFPGYLGQGNAEVYRLFANALRYVGGTGGNWLSVSPQSGTVAPGSSQGVTVKVNAKTLTVGNYSNTISITNNDSVNNPKNVPVNLSVIGPVITSVVPNSATQGQTLPVTITGQNTSFRVTQGSVTYDASHVWFSQGSSTINASSVSVSSATYLTANFTIPTTASTGLWNVNVEQPLSTGIVTLNNGFTINAGSGVVMSLSDAEVDFIGVRVGQFADITFTIRDSSISSGSLTGSVSLSGTGFTMLSGGGSFTLSPGQAWYVTVRYNAASAGFSRGTLTINNNSTNYPATAVIPVRGYGVQLTSSPKKILFDTLHGGNFGTRTDFVNLLRTAGHTVVTTQQIFNLSGYDYLLLSLQTSFFTTTEISQIQSFVNAGGNVLLLADWGGHFGALQQNALLSAPGWTTGMQIDTTMVRDSSQMINGIDFWIKLSTFPNRSDQLLVGVDTLGVFAATSLNVASPAQVIATTTSGGSTSLPSIIFSSSPSHTEQGDVFEIWMSHQKEGTKQSARIAVPRENNNNISISQSPMTMLPVIAKVSIGKGQVIVTGDMSIFGNSYNTSIYFPGLRYAANRIFALNIFQSGGSLISTPRILSVRDVPNDNGKQVFVRWKVDQPAVSSGIARFGVWRKDSVWTFLKDSVLTVNDTVFQFVAPTIYDSTKVSGMRYSVFRVSAHNVNPAIFTMSQPDSGYSLDNLAPSVPQGVKGSVQGGGTIAFLQWNKVPEKDLRYYAVYRSETAGFTQVDSTTFVGASADTTYRDSTVVYGQKYYYRIVAFDWSGNRSDPSDQLALTITSVGRVGFEIPKEFSLAQNYPNPFNPSTIIRYGVPTRSQVKVDVYNSIGQRVATLLDDERDAGYYEVEWRAAVASGIYIYRIEAVASDNPNNAFAQVKKMVLVR